MVTRFTPYVNCGIVMKRDAAHAPSSKPTDAMDYRRLMSVEEVAPLAEVAETEGFTMLSTLIAEWHDGSNRFALNGEALIGAFSEGKLVGVCGLNVDPYSSIARIGRVRRLYVLPEFRHRGIGSGLLRSVVQQAGGKFDELRVRTRDERASSSYLCKGFLRITDDPYCTHRLPLGVDESPFRHSDR